MHHKNSSCDANYSTTVKYQTVPSKVTVSAVLVVVLENDNLAFLLENLYNLD